MATVTTQTSLEASLEQPMSSPTYLLPPAPPKRFNYGIFLIALHTSLSGLLYGLDTGSIGPITEMPQFRESIGEISDLTQGIYVSSILLFAASASFGNGYLADRFSRRYTICLGGTLAAIGATISSSVSNLPALFVARGIYGIGIGLGWSTTTVYLVEIAPMEQRGLLGCMVQLLVTVGIAAAYFTAYGSVELSGSIAWRIPFIVQASVAVFLAIGMNFVPFSPRWLMQKGREHEALETLRKLRNVEVTDVQGMIAVNKELADIRSDIQLDQRAQKDTSYIEIFHKIDVILYFAPIIFTQAGFPSKQGSFLASGISGIILVIFTLPAQFYVDKVGRRKPLLIGGLVISTALLTLGSLYATHGTPLPDGSIGLVLGAPKYIAITSIYVIVATFSATWAIVGKLYTAEIIPNRYRAKTCSVQMWVNWTINFVVAFTAPYFLSKTASGPYFLYGALTLVGVVVLTVYMPETKGLELERIADVFGVAEEREMTTLATGRETPTEVAERRRRGVSDRRGSNA